MWIQLSNDRIVRVFEMHVRKSNDGYFIEGKTISGKWIGVTKKMDKESTMIIWNTLINSLMPKKGFKIAE